MCTSICYKVQMEVNRDTYKTAWRFHIHTSFLFIYVYVMKCQASVNLCCQFLRENSANCVSENKMCTEQARLLNILIFMYGIL
jgi:hypothetical protein